MRGAWVAALALLVRPASARDNGGVTVLPWLSEPLGARAVALGGAYDAAGDDLFALGVNPAGAGTLRGGEMAGTYHTGIEGAATQFLGLAVPLPGEVFPGEGSPILGLSAYLSQSGTIDVNQTNPDGSFLASNTISAGQDAAYGLTVAQRVAESVSLKQGEEFRTQHVIGLTGKYISSTLAENYTASTFAMDAGYQMHMPERGIDLGLSVMNLGGKLTYVTSGDPLPTSYRAGAAYSLRTNFGANILLVGSGEYRSFEKDYRYGLGFEYGVAKTYFLRAGWRIEAEAGGPTFGFGFREGAWQIDYGFETSRVFTAQHRFSLLYRFRAPWSRPERRKRTFIEELDLPKKLDDRRLEAPPTPEEKPQPVERGVPGWIY